MSLIQSVKFRTRKMPRLQMGVFKTGFTVASRISNFGKFPWKCLTLNYYISYGAWQCISHSFFQGSAPPTFEIPTFTVTINPLESNEMTFVPGSPPVVGGNNTQWFVLMTFLEILFKTDWTTFLHCLANRTDFFLYKALF